MSKSSGRRATSFELRLFAVFFSIPLTLLVLWLVGSDHPRFWWFEGGVIAFAAAGLAFPPLVAPVEGLLRPVALGVFWLFTRGVLVVTYYTAVLFTGIALRLLGSDPLDRKIDKKAPSYWHPRNPAEDKQRGLERYRRQF